MEERTDLTLTIHGLDEYNRDVDGEVFAAKLTAFLHALAVADHTVNGRRRHKFLLSDLKKNTATASFREQLSKLGPNPKSSMTYFREGLDDIYDNRQSARSLPMAFVSDIVKLSKGSTKQFAFAELKSVHNVVRIDKFLSDRAETILAEMRGENRQAANAFCGMAFGSFEGVLKAVDLRGDTQSAFLILKAGAKQIACVVNKVPREALRAALDNSVRVSGKGHYDATSQLPVRFDIRKVELLPTVPEADLARWRGTFTFDEGQIDTDTWA